jgi:Fe2+ transport system protein FeoA
VRRILSRKSETVSPDQELLEAEIALDKAGHEMDEAGSAAAEEEHEIAEAELETIVSKNTELSAEALLRLIRNRLRRDADISYETAQLAGAYATEHRGQPLGAELAGAFLSALAASGAFDEAFAELPRAIEEAGVSADTARSDLVDLLTRHAEDYDFLRHVLSEEDRPGALDAQTANAAAARLLALGFTSEAAGLVAGDAAGSHGRERKLLRAEIALRRGEPRLAEVELLGITGADANLLRAEARSMIGEHEAAQRLFSGVGEAHAARREAWLGSDWQALAEDEDPARSSLARLKLAEPGAEESATQGVLAGDRLLIDQSLDTRAAVQALLEATPVPRE